VREAGQAFERAADIQGRLLKDADDAANTLVDAYKAYRTSDPQAAVKCIEQSIQRYCVKGNFRRAASHKENLGELYENELNDPRAAADCYETAAGWYEGDNAQAYVFSSALLPLPLCFVSAQKVNALLPQ
jgi:alpha-soluble NSF attachment protein